MNLNRVRSPIALLVDLMAALSFLFLVLPLVVIVPMSFSAANTLEFPPQSWSTQHFVSLWEDQSWWDAAQNTMVVGLVAAVLATLASLPVAYILTQTAIRGKAVLRLLIMLPLITPLIVVAVATYSTYGPLGMSDSVVTLAVVHGALGVPLAFLAINASFEQFDARQAQAAQSLGASPLRAFMRVVVPAVFPGLVTGALFAFVYSFNEVVVAIFLGGRNSETLPRKMFDGILLEVDPVISAVATVMVLATLLVLLGVAMLRKKSSGKR